MTRAAASEPNKRPHRVSPTAWNRTLKFVDQADLPRLRRLAGLRFLAGLAPDEAVASAMADLEADAWRHPPWRDMVSAFGEITANGDLRRPNGAPPKHIQEAVLAVSQASQSFRVSRTSSPEEALRAAKEHRPMGVWLACAGCGGEMTKDDGSNAVVQWPSFGVQCYGTGEDIAPCSARKELLCLTFAQLLLQHVEALG